jgi:Fungal specific transcription factor domain
MSVAFPGSAKERRIFHRFQVRTIPALAGSSEIEFWESLVLKAGQQEPVVRNAIIALGTLHEDYQKRNGKYSQDLIEDPSYQQALSLYGKALRQLNERLYEGNRTTAKLALISSILFTCFEVLRRNGMAAIIHYQAGMRELTRQIKASREDEASSYHSSSAVIELRSIPRDELDVLLRVFARYDIQACTYIKPRAEALAVDLPPHPPASMTLPQVKLHLDNLLISIYQFIKSDLSMYRYWQSDAVPPDWLIRRDEAITTFENWLFAIEAFFRDSTSLVLRPHETKTLLGLRMQVKVAIILLKTCIDSAPETSFDAFLPDFDDIVTRIEYLADALSLREALPLDNESTSFTMELGILHPLFFVATKCRHWTVRRRAIAALKRGGREGVWEGPIVALVAERMMEIEEADVVPGEVIPEANRVHDVMKNVDYEGRQVLVEAKRSIDQVEWKKWEVIRESIKF